ncbi:hypothetical protein Dda3937_04642 [Dickeya dadantii 3937]|uniref:Uncharacterized protein n=1 Tax=Dickeya dadantii (strain 3937) TaxID=198628 RepID=E0SIQ4_DICD3|nr:hypothetical protein Dda3937_04642 [Dickeya dadantii 3937]
MTCALYLKRLILSTHFQARGHFLGLLHSTSPGWPFSSVINQCSCCVFTVIYLLVSEYKGKHPKGRAEAQRVE